jgi:hypothetical protein
MALLKRVSERWQIGKRRRAIAAVLYVAVLANLLGTLLALVDGYPSLVKTGLAAGAINVTLLFLLAQNSNGT